MLTRDVPPYVIVVAVPARLLRPRCDTRTAQSLHDLALGLEEARLAAAVPDFRALAIQAFAEKYAL